LATTAHCTYIIQQVTGTFVINHKKINIKNSQYQRRLLGDWLFFKKIKKLALKYYRIPTVRIPVTNIQRY